RIRGETFQARAGARSRDRARSHCGRLHSARRRLAAHARVDRAYARGRVLSPDHRAAERRCAGLPHQQARAQNQQGGEAMTKRRRTVPEGYVDEAIIEKLESSFRLVCNECLPTGTEIINAAGRILTLGLHAHLTYGNPSATTPEIEARLHKFAKQLQDLI